LRKERPLRWLWQDKIPLGKLTLIEGPPAVGKLFVALDIAARVSTGTLGGDDDHSPPSQSDPTPPDTGQSVILICDSWQAEDMLASRLKMLGADPGKIVTFTEVNCTDTCGGHKHRRPIRLPLDLPMFEYILRQHRGCRLIVIDNLENYCESPRQLRQAIQELDETAIYFGVAIVATLQGNVRFAPDGTIRDTARTIDGPARCIWSLTPDAAHPGLLRLEPKRMAFCKKPGGIACRISDAGQVVWEPLPPYEKPPTEAVRRKKLEQSRMLTWLEAILGTDVVPAATIYDAGREQGFSKNKLIAARDELGARTFKFGFGRAGGWLWTLKPDSEVTDAEVQIASIGLPRDFSLEPDAAQESENFGVLNENGGKMTGSPSSSAGRKRPRRFQDVNTALLREVGMQMLGLSPRRRPSPPEQPGNHAGNGHSGNGHSGNGHSGNGHSPNGWSE
jgi:hypothetical protein